VSARIRQFTAREFVERFVVDASQVLHEGMPADDRRRGSIGAQAAHRSQPYLEAAVVPLDPVVRILGRVVQHP